MFDKRFEGWYYKQSNGDITVAFFPGDADDGAFVQVITDSGSHIIRTEKLKIKGDTVKTGNCFFSPSGIKYSFPTAFFVGEERRFLRFLGCSITK